MTVLQRDGKRRAPGAPPRVRAFAEARVCAADACEVRLSRYNPTPPCGVHHGWDQEPPTRRRRLSG